jgi:hypothetical protein
MDLKKNHSVHGTTISIMLYILSEPPRLILNAILEIGKVRFAQVLVSSQRASCYVITRTKSELPTAPGKKNIC